METSSVPGAALIASPAACLAAAGSALPVAAQAPLELKIMAPAGPGGGWDSASRSLQQVLTATGAAKNVQVVNVPGAGGTVGLAQFVNNAKGDGSQLMVMGITMVGAVLTNKSPVGLDSVTPIARMTGDPLVIVVPANSPHKTVADLAAAIKADTSKVVWAGGSAGGADHILAGLVAKEAGGDPAKLNYVPFSGGGEALAEMLGGRVTAGVSGYNEFESQIKAKKLRALGVLRPASGSTGSMSRRSRSRASTSRSSTGAASSPDRPSRRRKRPRWSAAVDKALKSTGLGQGPEGAGLG